MARASRGTRGKKKAKKNVPRGIVHIQATFNNTIVTVTDMEGNTLSWASSGNTGFKGSRKSTPYAAQVTAQEAAQKAMENGLQEVEVRVKGPGSGREAAIRALQILGLRIRVIRCYPYSTQRMPSTTAAACIIHRLVKKP